MVLNIIASIIVLIQSIFYGKRKSFCDVKQMEYAMYAQFAPNLIKSKEAWQYGHKRLSKILRNRALCLLLISGIGQIIYTIFIFPELARFTISLVLLIAEIAIFNQAYVKINKEIKEKFLFGDNKK